MGTGTHPALGTLVWRGGTFRRFPRSRTWASSSEGPQMTLSDFVLEPRPGIGKGLWPHRRARTKWTHGGSASLREVAAPWLPTSWKHLEGGGDGDEKVPCPIPHGRPLPISFLPAWLSRRSEHARASSEGTLRPGLDDTAGVRTKPGASPLSPTPASESREPKSSPPPPATRKTQHPDLPPGASQHGHRGAQKGQRHGQQGARGLQGVCPH